MTYTHNNIEVPRATSICNLLAKPWLIKWANGMGLKGIDSTKYVEETADIGTAVHNAIQWHMMFNSEDKLNEELHCRPEKQQADILYGFNKYIESGEQQNIKGAQCELAFTCERFGGRIDVLTQYKDDRALLDIKTSNQVGESHKIQLAAYMELLLLNNVPFDKQGILLVPIRDEKKAKIYWYTNEDMDKYRKIFEHLLCILEIKKS